MKLKKNLNLSLDQFINHSLYDKKSGYYMKKNPFGKKGDFITAPNISRLFSEMISVWTIAFWQSLGSPKKFNLIELGAGNGEMMKDIIETLQKFPNFFNSCNFMIHEKSPSLIKIQKRKLKKNKITWVNQINKVENFPTLYLANEFFDAMAIKQFIKKKNLWFEKFVKFENNKKALFFEKETNIKNFEKKINLTISKNQNFIEYSELGFKYLKEISKIIKKNNGGLLIIDYGDSNKKMRNTLKGISNHKFANILKDIGNTDITYNINFSLFKKYIKQVGNLESNLTSQKKFLLKLGIKERAEIISKNLNFSEKANIYYRLKRLIDDQQMGSLFKVMLIKNKKNRFNLGF